MPNEFPTAPKGGLAGFVERTLKEALLSGRLMPGERLVTREMAAKLGTSPTPVREALLKLVAAGVLEATPAQAFLVPVVTPERYRELSEIRKAIEGLAAETAATRITSAALAELQALNERFRRARRQGDVAEALEHNRRFRFLLYEAAGMPTLSTLIETLWLQIGPSLNFLYPQPPAADADRHNYDEILDGLARGDGARVRAAVVRAIDEGTEFLVANLRSVQGANAG